MHHRARRPLSSVLEVVPGDVGDVTATFVGTAVRAEGSKYAAAIEAIHEAIEARILV